MAASGTITSSPPSRGRDGLHPVDQPERHGRGPDVARCTQADPVRLPHQPDQLGPRSLGDDSSLVDDPDPVAQPLGLFHVVGGVEDPDALAPERLDAGQDGVAALGVDADRGLVEHEQSRAVEEPDGDVEPALHATGIAGGAVALAVAQLDHVEHLTDPGTQSVAPHPVEAAEVVEVLPRGEVGIDRQFLGHEPDEALRVGRPDVERLPGDDDLSLVTGQDPADHRDRRRLARSVGAQQPVRLAGRDLEPDPVHRLPLAEPLPQPAAPEHRGDAGRARRGCLNPHDGCLHR